MSIFYNMFGHTLPYASGNVHPFGVDWENYPIHSWGRASDQIRNPSPLSKGLSFLLLGYAEHSICVTKSGISDLEIDWKIKRYSGKDKKATLYIY
jgi:hypothetical protein